MRGVILPYLNITSFVNLRDGWCNVIFSFRASFRTNHVTLTWRNLTDSDSSNPCLSSSLLFKASLIQREREDASVDFLKDSAVNFADSESIVEMESPKVHEAGKVEETHQKVDPWVVKLSSFHLHLRFLHRTSPKNQFNYLYRESEESKEDPNATRVLALDMILKVVLFT